MTPGDDGRIGPGQGMTEEEAINTRAECERDNRQHSVEYWEARGLLRGLALGRAEKEEFLKERQAHCECLHTKDAATIAALEKRNAELVEAMEKVDSGDVGCDHVMSETCFCDRDFIRDALAKHKSEGKCNHESTWFDRSMSLRADGEQRMADICINCGKEVL